MKEPVRADRPADDVESDLADLAAISVAELRRHPAAPSRRLLDETRRPRGNAIAGGGGNPPGRAE